MSFHDAALPGVLPAPAAGRKGAGGIARLEGISGLISDLTNQRIAHTRENLEQAVRDRLGDDATVEDARHVVNQLDDALRDLLAD